MHRCNSSSSSSNRSNEGIDSKEGLLVLYCRRVSPAGPAEEIEELSIRQFAHSLVLKPEGGTYVVVVVVANMTQQGSSGGDTASTTIVLP